MGRDGTEWKGMRRDGDRGDEGTGQDGAKHVSAPPANAFVFAYKFGHKTHLQLIN